MLSAGHVVFVIKSQYDDYELPLKTWNNRILLETLKEQLEMHKPPLRPKTVNNVPISVRHDDKTLQVDLHSGQRLEVGAEVLPGRTVLTITSAILHGQQQCCWPFASLEWSASLFLSLAGFQPFIAYPQNFVTKRLLSSWIHT